MDRIIISLSPVERIHKVFVIKNDNLVDQCGVCVENLPEVITMAADKYNIANIDISGVKAYTEKIGIDIEKYNLTNYTNRELNIYYVEGDKNVKVSY